MLYEGLRSRKEMENPVYIIIRENLYLLKEKSDREQGHSENLKSFKKELLSNEP